MKIGLQNALGEMYDLCVCVSFCVYNAHPMFYIPIHAFLCMYIYT